MLIRSPWVHVPPHPARRLERYGSKNSRPIFGYQAGNWRVDKHIRELSDLNGDGRADIIGFGDAGVWTALSAGARFADPVLTIADFGAVAGSWEMSRHVRLVGDVIGERAISVVGFGNDGVHVHRFF